MENKENILGTKNINKLLFSMGIPIMCSMLVGALYNIVDSYFVSQIGQDAFKAVNFAFPIQNLIISVGVGTAIGMNALLSKRLGEKEYDEANKIANTGVFLGIVSALIFAVLGFFGSELYMKSVTDSANVIEMGTTYLRIITVFSFGVIMQCLLERFLQLTGNTVYQMVAQLTGTVINIILDPILIFGIGIFPELGITGAAIATIIGQFSGMIFCIIVNQLKNKAVTLSVKSIRFNKKATLGIYKVGVPSIIMMSIGSVTTYGMNLILESLSEVAVNVLGSFFKLQSFVFMPIFGLTNAMVPIVGYNYGARNKARIIQTIRSSNIASLWIMVVGTAIFMIVPELLLNIFSPTDEIIKMGLPAMRFLSLSFIPAGFCIVYSSAFQALGNGMYSLYMSLIRQIVVILPVAYILGALIGVEAVWFSYPIAELACLVMAIYFYKRIYRKRIADLEQNIK